MAESIVQVTEGVGKKLHTNSYTVGANTVEDEFVLPGPFPYATYIAIAGTISIATATDHILTLNAGASLKLRIVSIHIEQSSNATAAALASFSIFRTTTGAPTGGTAVTPALFDTSDAASGAAARTLPAVKGTETTEILRIHMPMRQAILATGAQMDDVFDWHPQSFSKPILVPTGTTNGIVIKNNTAVAGAAVDAWFEFVETAF